MHDCNRRVVDVRKSLRLRSYVKASFAVALACGLVLSGGGLPLETSAFASTTEPTPPAGDATETSGDDGMPGGAETPDGEPADVPEEGAGTPVEGEQQSDSDQASEPNLDGVDDASLEKEANDLGARVEPRATAALPVCTSGTVYAISGDGQMQQVANGTVTSFGTKAPNVSDFNGLGIGSGGTPVYAYNRTNSARTVTMFSFDTATGTWTSTGAAAYDTSTTANGNFNGSLVAGAINLQNGMYLFGGFETTSSWDWGSWTYRYTQVFKLWEYNPTSKAFTYKGYVNTYAGTSDPGASNGDMAFDANGNLFIVRGSGTTTTIYPVTSAALASAANGSVIASQPSNPVTTQNNVSGVAFDADGKGYLSSSSEVRSYDMPGWTNSTTVTSGISGGADLAGCGSPPTITIEKVVEGGRLAATDQFTLSLKQGTTEIGTATTTGNTTGVQTEKIGPLPTVRNVALSFSESGAGSTNLNNYVSSYRCLVDGTQTVQGDGTSGSITIPASGKAVNCQFYNSPLTATVTINKQTTDSSGGNALPGAGWTVGAAATATTGTVTGTPTAATQTTDAAGNATWNFKFGAKTGVATVKVHEVQQTGFAFASGSCTVTHLNGTTTVTTLPSASEASLTGIVPGDRVDCTYLNKVKPAKVTITKQVQDVAGQNPTGAAGWTVGAALTSPPTGVQISDPATQVTGTDGTAPAWTIDFPKWAQNTTMPSTGVTVHEDLTSQTGYAFVGGSCTITPATGTATTVTFTGTPSKALTGVKPGDAVACTFTNKPNPGTVTWEKVDNSTPAQHLAGSEWKIEGPSPATTQLTVADCVAADAAGCASANDKDHRAGYFKVTGLAWGDYTLTESKAPAGYAVDDTVHSFTITYDDLDYAFDAAFVNKQITPPDLPFTGGWFGRNEIVTLGLLILGLGGAAAVAIRIDRRRKAAA